MKNNYQPVLLLGFAGGLICWSLYEFLLFTIPQDSLSPGILALISGGLAGALPGGFIGGLLGFLKHSFNRIKRSMLGGALFGLFGGALTFALVQYADQNFSLVAGNVHLNEYLFAVQWFFVALFIGIGLSLFEYSHNEITRKFLAAATTSVCCTILILVFRQIIPSTFGERGLSFIAFCLLYSYFLFYFSSLKRKEWIKSLNGQLAGMEFELTKESIYLGTQSCDDINLRFYDRVNPAHAKLIRYYTGYSLTDNDPLGQTYVNFRSIKEQPLKNGDILKIGTALFQYCRNDL